MTSNWSKMFTGQLLESISSFGMSIPIGYETLIFVVMEVNWVRIFGQGEVKWPLIDLKCWQVNYWSPYLSFDMSLDICIGYENSILWSWRSYRSQMTSNWSKMLAGQLLESLSFIWYVARIGYEAFIFVVMEVILGHIFGHREVKWPPMGI